MDYSVIVPLSRQSQLVEPLLKQWLDVFSSMSIVNQCEILLVDTHLDDKAKATYQELIARYPQVSVISLRRNTSQSMAISIGLHASSGKYAITLLDGVKTSLYELPHLMKKVARGYDIAINKKSSGQTSLMMCKRKAIKYIQSYRHLRLLLPKIARHEGLTLCEMSAGKSNQLMTIWTKTVSRLFDGYLLAQQRPGMIFGLTGAGFMLLSLLMGSFATFILGINTFLIGLGCEIILAHLQKPQFEQQARYEIDTIIGSDYSKQKITYGLLSSRMKQAS